MRFTRNKYFVYLIMVASLVSICVILGFLSQISNLSVHRISSISNRKQWQTNVSTIDHLIEKNNELLNEISSSLEKVIESRLKSFTNFTAASIVVNHNVPIIPILLLSCNRKYAVDRSLKSLLRFKPKIPVSSVDIFPIIVSQDCGDEETKEKILAYSSNITFLEHPNQDEIYLPKKEKKFKGYYKIARHYGWALNQVFFRLNYDFVIVVEDDLEISVDFYYYFLGTYKLLQNDKTIWCVSAWNDNGKANLIDINQPSVLYRTDFFPGLGWMTTKQIWTELSAKWPKTYWDDWARNPEQRKERSCIRPEISRTKTFGKFGVSNGLYFEKHLKYTVLNEKFIDFSRLDVSYLEKESYDKQFLMSVNQAYAVTMAEVLTESLPTDKNELQISYYNATHFKSIARKFGLMDDFRAGVPRTSYLGIVTFHFKNRKIYIRPAFDWNGYNISWH